jgi:transcriptional regulator GlxA family with amidase domain
LLERLAEPVRLDELADHVRLDKYHLIRAFRAELGAPPYEYLTHARIYRARELLRAGSSPSAVAPAVGYYDQSQLHRHFLKIVGTTPGQYARSTGRARWPAAPPLLREEATAVPKRFSQ